MSPTPTPISYDILSQIHDEILEHMKISGVFDDLRVNLMDPIWTDSDFKDIIERFEIECEKFCFTNDLEQNRNSLRAKLAAKICEDSPTGSLLKTHIDKLLRQQNEVIRDKYLIHAKEYLQKFLPEPSPSPSPSLSPSPSPTTDKTNQVKSEFDQDSQNEMLQPEMEVDMEISSSSSVFENNINTNNITPTPTPTCIDMDITATNTNTITTPTSTYTPMNITNTNTIDTPTKDENEGDDGNDDDDIERPAYSPIGDDSDSDDEIIKLKFSPVSSVDTADLSDFDNSIKLSDDDEANVVGKPKNSKVPIKEIQGKIEINDLQVTNIKVEPKEPPPAPNIKSEIVEPIEQASESDGGFSENNTSSRRIARTRKSNPRYSSDQFKLL